MVTAFFSENSFNAESKKMMYLAPHTRDCLAGLVQGTARLPNPHTNIINKSLSESELTLE